VISDPLARGRSLAAFFLRLEPSLWADIDASGLLEGTDLGAARGEWSVLALHACVRGLVAAGGFGDDNARALETFHAEVASAWNADPIVDESADERHERVAERMESYDAIALAAESRGAETVLERLGTAAARYVSGTDIARAGLADMLSELHDAIAQGSAESVREATA